MKKITFLCFLGYSLFISFHVNSTELDNTTAQANKAASPTVKTKRKHRLLPNGPISLDIVEYGDTFHMLIGKHDQGKKTLWYQQSIDAGSSWTDAVKIINTDHMEANFGRGSDARLAIQDQNIVAIWASRREGERHNAGPMSAARSSDNGKTWQVSPIPADWLDGTHNFFAMAGNDELISAVWLDRRVVSTEEKKAKKGLRQAQSVDGGLTWTDNITLDDKTCACCWNTAKYSDSGDLFVLYRNQEPSDMSMIVLDKNQKSTSPNTVGAFDWDFKGCPHIGGGIAFQDDSRIMHSIVGTGKPDNQGVYYLRSANNGKSWTEPVALGDDSALHSDLAASEDGRVIAVWDMSSKDGLSTYYSESLDKGLTWSATKPLSKSGARATHPRVVVSGSKFLTLWTQSTDGKNQSLQMQQL